MVESETQVINLSSGGGVPYNNNITIYTHPAPRPRHSAEL